MKVKKVVIQIKSDKELFEEVKTVWGKLEKGQAVKKHVGIYFQNLDAMRKVLTEERLKVLRAIRAKRPASIYALAKMLKRDVKNTHDDVAFLAEAGLVDLKKSKAGRSRVAPTVNYAKISLEIPV